MYEKRDCRVASLLAMTKKEVMTLPVLCIGKDGLDESSPSQITSHPHPALSPQGRGKEKWIPAFAGMT